MLANSRVSMIARLLLIGAVGVVTMGAQSSCSTGDRDSGSGTSTGPTLSVTLALTDSSGHAKGRFTPGELITFELTVLNRTNAPIRLQLPGSNQDFQIFRPGDTDTLWDWAANRIFTTVITDVTLDAGGSTVFRGTWDQVLLNGAMLDRGPYEATGQFFRVEGHPPALTEADTKSPRVRFMVN